jgi:hypothetical protein
LRCAGCCSCAGPSGRPARVRPRFYCPGRGVSSAAGEGRSAARSRREKPCRHPAPRPQRTQQASTSLAALGVPAVSTSCPCSVTSTSSSIRIPTPRRPSGAAASSAAT